MPAARLTFDRPVPELRVTPHPFTGFGAQLNTNIYRPITIFPDRALAALEHKKDPDQEGQPNALTRSQENALRRAIVNMRLGHSRVFVGKVLVSTPEPPANEFKAFLSTLRLAEAAGAPVNLTFWGQGSYEAVASLQSLRWPGPPFGDWPSELEQQGHVKWPDALGDGGALTRPADLMARFANIIAKTREAGLTCVKYATIQNEPNQGPTDLAHKGKPALSMRFYERLYRLLARELADRGIHDVDLVAGDLVRAGQREWLRYIRTNMDRARPHFDSVVHGYSIHVYWEPGGGPKGFPQQLEGRLKSLAAQINALEITKPVYVTEFGVRTHAKPAPDGRGSGQRIEFARDIAFQHAWFMALAPQYGCAGLVKWVLYRTDRRSAWGEWGMIDAPNPGPPAGRTSLGRSHTYWVTQLFNHLVDREGWKASGFGRSGDGTAIASRFTGPGNESIVVLNRRGKAQPVVVDGLRPRRYFVADWNGGPARERSDPLTPKSGSLQLTVPAHGVVALSTRPFQLP